MFVAYPCPSVANHLAVPQIHHVHVSPQANVIRQVPAHVVGIFVDHDVIPGPIPVTAESQIRIGNREIEAVEPEPRRAAAAQMPPVGGTESATEMAVLPRMIDMESRIVLAGIVPDPGLAIHVGGFRMTGLIRKMLLGRRSIVFRRLGSIAHRSRTTRRGFTGCEVGLFPRLFSAFPLLSEDRSGSN